jgi:hypothetical protein
VHSRESIVLQEIMDRCCGSRDPIPPREWMYLLFCYPMKVEANNCSTCKNSYRLCGLT